jgi:hypothetical protein
MAAVSCANSCSNCAIAVAATFYRASSMYVSILTRKLR